MLYLPTSLRRLGHRARAAQQATPGNGRLFSVVSHSSGRLAEWLGRALQKLVQRFKSATDLIESESFNAR